MTTSKANITIAIVGGGLGGLTSAIALGRAGYDVHLFEQANEFSQIGAGIAIGPNAVKAFYLLDIGEEYEEVADMRPAGADFFRYLKWDDNRELALVSNKGPTSFVHRKRVLEALLKVLPPNVTRHFNSRISEVQNLEGQDGQPSRVRLHVSASQRHDNPDWPGEQSVFDADAVIGSDGVRSVIRTCIGLSGDGPDDAGCVRYTGIYAYRGLLDMEAAVKKEGEAMREPIIWCGPDKHILTFPVEGGTIMNVVAFVSTRSQPHDQQVWTGPWVKPTDQKTMLDDFADFDEKPRNLLKLIEDPEQWALHELVSLDRWTVGRVTLLGDSAHASLPHNGAGAGQAIEDAYVLGELLKMPECTAKTLPRFLQAYEDARRERAAHQQNHSRESGLIYQLALSGKGNSHDVDQLATHMKGRYDWIWDHDLGDDIKLTKQKLASEGFL